MLEAHTAKDVYITADIKYSFHLMIFIRALKKHPQPLKITPLTMNAINDIHSISNKVTESMLILTPECN